MPDHLYGPVPSRRLGRSLGVDLVPPKTCTFDCIYCQLGSTDEPALKRAEYVSADEIAEELEEALSEGPRPDYLTLAGSGEPTLNSALGQIVSRIKRMTDVPVALLTNGSLFYRRTVREECGAVDLLLPSLDASNEEMFRYVNRPHPDLTLELLVDGLAAMRDEFEGEIWLEVFILLGVNSFAAQVREMQGHIERIRPDRIQLNTAVRPPAEKFAYPVARKRLEEISAMLGPKCEIIADMAPAEEEQERESSAQEVLTMLLRRPCTVEDIASGLSVHRNEAVKYVQRLLEEGLVETRREGAEIYYYATRISPSHPERS